METEDFQRGSILEEGFVRGRPQSLSDMPCWHAHFLDLWDIIKRAESARDDESVMAHQSALKKCHRAYTSKIDGWLEDHKLDLENLSPEDKHTKLKAHDIRKRFERGIYKYSLCYMYLNRYLIHARKDLNDLLNHIPHQKKSNPGTIQIQDNVGFLLRRAYREKFKFMAQREKLERMKTVLLELDPLFLKLECALYDVFGKARGKRAYRSFRASIRQINLDAAEALCAKWVLLDKPRFGYHEQSKKDLKNIGHQIIKYYTAHEDDLLSQNQFVLNVSDLRIMSSFITVGEERVDMFIQKYSLPYLGYKFKFMLKQAYRLGAIGNFEKLFLLYERLVHGMAFPMDTAADVQKYEGEVLRQVEYIMSSGVSNIPDILDQTEEATEQIRYLLGSVRGLFRD